jgi:hypothetical protein
MSPVSSLLARGYPLEQLCERFTVTPEQLARAARAPPFDEAFQPLGEFSSSDSRMYQAAADPEREGSANRAAEDPEFSGAHRWLPRASP